MRTSKIRYNIVLGRNGHEDRNGTMAVHVEAYQDGQRVTFHTARHTCGSLLLREEVPVTTVQMFLGHRKLETTKGYAEVFNE